jgi:drug/metabolite transporter (DMT)-like permease
MKRYQPVNELSVGRHLLIVVAAFGILVSQLLMKQGVTRGGPITVGSPEQLWGLMQRILTTPTLFLGYVLSFATGLLWLVILSRVELSYAVPLMTGIYFLLLLLTSMLVLGESVTPAHWLGTLLILSGIALIARSG